MASRLGPVFDTEMTINARRWQAYAGRSAFVVALLIGMTTIWWSYLDESWSVGIKNQAKLGEAYFYAMVGVQLALTMIVAPAATAGAVCVERSRGSLAHMLVTDLRAPEIILGKLCARLVPTFFLIACAWPVAAIGSLLGGINPEHLTMAFAITLAVGLLGCSMALALSAWAKSVHEVLLAVYTFWGLAILSYPIGFTLSFTFGGWFARRWMLLADPFWLAFAPYVDPGKYGPWEYAGFFGVTLGLSAVAVLLAVVGVRVNPLDASRPKRRGRAFAALRRIGLPLRWLPGPSLDGNPVLWREWHRGRSSRPIWLLMMALVLASTGLCLHGAYEVFVQGFNNRAGFSGVMAMMIQTLFGLLMLVVFASLSFSEERRRGSLDVLLATPLSTRSIVSGKWLATFRVVPLLAIGPCLLCWAFAQDDLSRFLATQPAQVRSWYNSLGPQGRAFGVALAALTILAHGAWITSLGLALAVWVRRESRAIALAVAAYVLIAVGLPFVVIFLAGPSGGNTMGDLAWFYASSPVMVGLQLVEILSARPPRSVIALNWIAAWDAIATVAAFALYEATVRTFDRKFDRVPEWAIFRPRRRRVERSDLPFLEVVGTPAD